MDPYEPIQDLFCYPHLRLALQLGYSQPSAFQAAVGEDSKKKRPWAESFFFLLSSPEAGAAAWLAHAWRNCTVTLSLQPPKQLRVRIAPKKWRRKSFFFAILTRSCLKGHWPGL